MRQLLLGQLEIPWSLARDHYLRAVTAQNVLWAPSAPRRDGACRRGRVDRGLARRGGSPIARGDGGLAALAHRVVVE